jgi:hypothetical protein
MGKCSSVDSRDERLGMMSMGISPSMRRVPVERVSSSGDRLHLGAMIEEYVISRKGISLMS